jgi:glutamine synthetase
MAMTAADVMKMVKEKEVKFVDFRFTDTRGKEQHVTVPVKHFTMDKFEHGHAFDGSSIAGWKGIEASDMLLMPDPVSARMDPFSDEPVLNISCDVIEPADMKPYNRDPRSIAKKAEAYLKSTGLGDTAYFGPEPEFFIFDSVTWNVDMSGCAVKIKSEEAPWSSGDEYEGGNMAHRAPVKGGYFPVPPVGRHVSEGLARWGRHRALCYGAVSEFRIFTVGRHVRAGFVRVGGGGFLRDGNGAGQPATGPITRHRPPCPRARRAM